MPDKITDKELEMLIDLYKDYNTVHDRAIYLAAVELQKYREFADVEDLGEIEQLMMI